MLLDGADPLLQAFDAFLNLAIRELDERAGFSELLVQIGSIVRMASVEVHLEAFSNKLEFVPKAFSQNTGMPLGFGNFNSKSFSGSADNLPNLRQ
jgi:hypothetical protein